MKQKEDFRTADFEDIFVWPDDCWCYRYELYEFDHKSDDYQVIFFDTELYQEFFNNIFERNEIVQLDTFAVKFNTISDCLKNFNFEKVHQVMMYLDWKWYIAERGYKIPCLDELKHTATRLASDAYDAVASGHNNYTVGTGGFEAFAERIKDTGEIVVELKFVLEMS